MCAMLKCWIYIYILSAWFVKFEHLHMQMSEWELWGLVGLRNRIMMDLSITGSRQPFWKAVFGEMACFFFVEPWTSRFIYFVFFGDIQLFSSGLSVCYLHQSRKGLSQQTVEYHLYYYPLFVWTMYVVLWAMSLLMNFHYF